jgi:hypothetical protein
MVNTIFKGDVAEISWGKETGLTLTGDTSSNGWANIASGATADTSVIQVGNNAYWVSGGIMEIPDNALAGCILRISSTGNYANDDYATTRRTYYIVGNDTTNATITVQPRLASGTANADGNSTFSIDSVRCPTVDTGMTDTAHGVKTDQFFGLLDNFSLPEPDIDVRMQHVVGMGRDVNVLTSGKETLTGGSFTANAHNFRWMKYGLGGHTAISEGQFIEFKEPNANNAEDMINIKQGGNAQYGLHQYKTSNKIITQASASAYTGNNFLFPADVTRSCDTNNTAGSGSSFGSNPKIVQLASGVTTGLQIGMRVSGAGIATGSRITQIDSASLFRVDLDTTATAGGVTITFNHLTWGYQVTAGSVSEKTGLVGGATATGSSNTVVFTHSIADTHESVPTYGGVFKTLNTFNGLVNYGTFDSAATTTLTGTANIINLGASTQFGNGATGLAGLAGNVVYVLPPIVESIKRGDVRVKLDTNIASHFEAGEYIQIIDGELHTIPGQDAATTSRQIPKNEIRRIVGIEGQYVYVEEPFFFAHKHGTATQTSHVGVEKIKYGVNYSPTLNTTTKELAFGIVHTMFGDTSLPTFMIEQSFRRDDASPGAEQLLRLYNGCKVQSIGFSANTEGEVKLQVDYEAGRHYTDTANLFSPKRMFEDIADTAVNRTVSGIAIGGEKPYLFQDMNISIFGTTVLRATQVNFGLNNSNETRHYIRGYAGNTVDTDQVQQAGVQMPMDYTEAKREYTFSFSAIIEDDQLWNQMRTRKHHENANDIVMSLKKVGSNLTRESAKITIEDYTIKKADHQIPDSKGAVLVDVELIVRHLKVVENSVYLGY